MWNPTAPKAATLASQTAHAPRASRPAPARTPTTPAARSNQDSRRRHGSDLAACRRVGEQGHSTVEDGQESGGSGLARGPHLVEEGGIRAEGRRGIGAPALEPALAVGRVRAGQASIARGREPALELLPGRRAGIGSTRSIIRPNRPACRSTHRLLGHALARGIGLLGAPGPMDRSSRLEHWPTAWGAWRWRSLSRTRSGTIRCHEPAIERRGDEPSTSPMSGRITRWGYRALLPRRRTVTIHAVRLASPMPSSMPISVEGADNATLKTLSPGPKHQGDLPHLQGQKTIAGFEGPSSRAYPTLGQRPAADGLPSGAKRFKVSKSVDPSRQRSYVAERGSWMWAKRINRSDSQVSQPQDGPKWVNLSPQARSHEGRLAAQLRN